MHRRRDSNLGSRTELVNLADDAKGKGASRGPARPKVPTRPPGADRSIGALKRSNARRAKGAAHLCRSHVGQPGSREEPLGARRPQLGRRYWAPVHAHDPSDVAGLVFVDATHEAIDARSLAMVPAMYSLMLFVARAKFVRRGLVRQLCPPGSSHEYRKRIEGRLNDPIRWPIGIRTARAESAAIPARRAVTTCRSSALTVVEAIVGVLDAVQPNRRASV